MPIIYALHFGLRNVIIGLDPAINLRLAIMMCLSALWGIRLTFNFARKGGYAWSSEDYRWPVLRKYMSPTLFQIFNIVFIAIYQNILIFLFCTPAYVAWKSKSTPLNVIDYTATGFFLVFLLFETIADQQQWNFQSKKYQQIAEKKELSGDYKLGFIRTGLFRYSRHPNFFCEQGVWWSYFMFSVAASGVIFNWSILGALLLSGLFQGSTAFTEFITKQKYPAYATYQTQVSRIIPWFSRIPNNEDNQKKEN